MGVVKLDTSAGDFQNRFQSEIIKPTTIVLYSAEWCMNCKVALAHILQPIALEYPFLNLLYVYTPSNAADSAPVNVFPVFELYEMGRKLASAEGANRQTKDTVNGWAAKHGKQLTANDKLFAMMKLAAKIQNRLS